MLENVHQNLFPFAKFTFINGKDHVFVHCIDTLSCTEFRRQLYLEIGECECCHNAKREDIRWTVHGAPQHVLLGVFNIAQLDPLYCRTISVNQDIVCLDV